MADTGPIGGSRPPLPGVPGGSSTAPGLSPFKPVEPPKAPDPLLPDLPKPTVPVPGRSQHVVEVVENDGFSGDPGAPQELPSQSPDKFATPRPQNDLPHLDVPEPARPREVQEVLPDLMKVEQPAAVPDRLVADLTMIKQQLVDAQGQTRADAAQKLVGFAAEYVERFIALAPPLSHEAGDQQQRQGQPENGKQGLKSETKLALANAKLDHALDEALTKAGLSEVKDVDTGQSARDLLRAAAGSRQPESARSLAEERRFDAPTWPLRTSELAQVAVVRPDALPLDHERDARAGAVQNNQAALQLDAASRRAQLGLVNENRPVDGRLNFDEILEAQKSRRSRDGVLGRNMIWNLLHRLRGSDLEDEEARKESQARIVIAGFAIVLALGVAVVAMLSM